MDYSDTTMKYKSVKVRTDNYYTLGFNYSLHRTRLNRQLRYIQSLLINDSSRHRNRYLLAAHVNEWILQANIQWSVNS